MGSNPTEGASRMGAVRSERLITPITYLLNLLDIRACGVYTLIVLVRKRISWRVTLCYEERRLKRRLFCLQEELLGRKSSRRCLSGAYGCG